MNRHGIGVSVFVLVALMLAGSLMIWGQGRSMSLKAVLDGYNETPAVSTTGSGEFRATVDHSDAELSYTLQYSDLEGATTMAAHVHLGQTGVAGGVSFFLCGGGGKPACPNTSGSVSGTVTAADVIGPVGQGIAAGEFAEILRAMRSGVTYVNVHTEKHPGGEIRGQIKDNASEK